MPYQVRSHCRARSAVLSVANSLADCLEVLRTLDVPIERALLIGGGSHTVLADSNDRLLPGDTAGGSYPQFFTNASGQTLALVNTASEYSYVGRLTVTPVEGEAVQIRDIALQADWIDTQVQVHTLALDWVDQFPLSMTARAHLSEVGVGLDVGVDRRADVVERAADRRDQVVGHEAWLLMGGPLGPQKKVLTAPTMR